MNTRSKAMKKSWKERRNSPGRKLARERAKKVTQRVTLESIAQSLNEIRSMIVAPPPPSNGSVAHIVEVSKRLDELRGNTGKAIASLNGIIAAHVKGFEEKLADLLEKLDAVAEGNLANHNRLNRVEDKMKRRVRK